MKTYKPVSSGYAAFHLQTDSEARNHFVAGAAFALRHRWDVNGKAFLSPTSHPSYYLI
ncbi:Uncharacterized protein DAT39_018902 [Clarias magur]|uniref:Uncharacterized protein n=1 Tax=Clarias magur TaxID=1594786 RepID=A0A8J4TNH0_CLAMG|nr:Uncharacterized protein DAT39_018902 [Clarias magur]